jgi:hypothetical protein
MRRRRRGARAALVQHILFLYSDHLLFFTHKHMHALTVTHFLALVLAVQELMSGLL